MIVTFITTVNHNIGDDFVREGIKYLLGTVFPGKKIKFQNIHKHSPISVRHGFEWFQKLKLWKFNFPSEKLDKLLPLNITKDKILEADLVIQSGAPVYWCHKNFGSHCADNEWFDVLIRHRFSINKKAKLLNIAAGSCQSFYSVGDEFINCEKDVKYVKEFFNLSSLTTVRDKVAFNILKSIGLDTRLIPCPSIFAIDEYHLKPSKKKYFIINYMNIGGHYTFGEKINSIKWQIELKTFYDYVKNLEEILFVCHSKNEIKNVKKIDPMAKVFYSDNYLDYMNMYSSAKYGVMNRVHGAFLMASFGAPSFIVGNDTRARMAEEIGLESLYINDVSADILIEKYKSLKIYSDIYPGLINSIKEKAFKSYCDILSEVLIKY